MDLCEVVSIITLCHSGIQLNVIKDILLSMKSNHILKNVLPGEITILYKEDESYVYARNDGDGLVIERALVPGTQVKRVNFDSLDVLHKIELDKRAKKIGNMLRVDEDKDVFKVVIEGVSK